MRPLLPRTHLFELEDQPWFPTTIRDLATDYLVFLEAAFGLDRAIVPVLRRALDECGESTVVDLCSGAGGPAIAARARLAAAGRDVRLLLTDLYPNVPALERARSSAPGRIEYEAEPVDARNVDPGLRGVRTMFNAFHHFTPPDARRILADAVAHRRVIAIFDVPERAVPSLIAFFLLTPLFVFLATPFIRPFRWRRLLWTYLLPLVPLTCWWDGVVSHLRAYTVEELTTLAREVDAPCYSWRAGRAPVPGTPGHTVYLVGVPVARDAVLS